MTQDAGQRQRLEELEALLMSRDSGKVRRGLQLLGEYAEPALCAPLAAGLSVSEAGQVGWTTESLVGRSASKESNKELLALRLMMAHGSVGEATRRLVLKSARKLESLDELAVLTGLESLTLEPCTRLRSLSGIERFARLEHLVLRECGKLTELSPLGALGALRTLELLEGHEHQAGCVTLRSLEGLEAHGQLEALTLQGCERLVDISAVGALSRLRSLVIDDCQQLVELGPLGTATALEELVIRKGASGLQLSSLAALTSLRVLEVNEPHGAVDLSGLSQHARLEHLALRSCGRGLVLPPLSGLVRLSHLALERTSLPDLSPLTGLPALESLTLYRLTGGSEPLDLTPLGTVTTLASLKASGNERIQELGPLASLESLESLDLSRCQSITDITPIVGLGALRALDVSSCSLVELPALHGLTSLERLDTTQNWRLGQTLQRRSESRAEVERFIAESADDAQPFTPEQLAQGEAVLALLGHDDWARVEQGLELLLSLDEPALNAWFGRGLGLDDAGRVQGDATRDRRDKQRAPLATLNEVVSWCHRPSVNLRLLVGLDLLPADTRTLDLYDCEHLSELGFVAGLADLESLTLPPQHGIDDLSPLATSTTLTSLRLGRSDDLADLSALAGLTQLTELSVASARLGTLEHLVALTALRRLRVNGSEVLTDLGPLASLTELTFVDLGGCAAVSSLAPLAALSRLEVVHLHRCGGTDLGPLSGLESLTHVTVDSDSPTLPIARSIVDITARSFGTEYDVECFYLPDRDLLVSFITYSKTWMQLSWTGLSDARHDAALTEGLECANTEWGSGDSSGTDVEGADVLDDDEAFQIMLEEEHCGDLLSYCLEAGQDPWSANLPASRTRDLPESRFDPDRTRIYDIEVVWSDGSVDRFPLGDLDFEPLDPSAAEVPAALLRVHRGAGADSATVCRLFCDLMPGTVGP